MSTDVKTPSAAARVATVLKPIGASAMRDGPGLAGILLISGGVHEIYAPAGWIVFGLFLLVGSFLAARARVESAKRDAMEPKA